MQVKDLFEKQDKLDSFIMGKLKQKGVNITEPSQLLCYRLLALITEVGEIAEATEEEKLEEYADLMHFVLSVGNLTKSVVPYATTKFRNMYELIKLKTETNWLEALESFIIAFSRFSNITRCFKYWSDKKEATEQLNAAYIDMFLNFIYMGHALEFSAEQVEEAYLIKNKINYQRQNEGY